MNVICKRNGFSIFMVISRSILKNYIDILINNNNSLHLLFMFYASNTHENSKNRD